MAYLKTVVDPYYEIDKEWATIVLLAFFCILTNLGMKESAMFATVIFVLHVATLTLLTILGTLHIFFNPEDLLLNYSATTPSFPMVNMAGKNIPGSMWTALFYGFSSASKSILLGCFRAFLIFLSSYGLFPCYQLVLGVSGFETSAQFVEEQAPGVFPKTLRNMWLGIMIFNPMLSLISFSALTLEEIMEHHETVLARTADVVGTWIQKALFGLPAHSEKGGAMFGRILSGLVSIDAFIVLAASLLTGYVGINGLVRRMSMDRCLPQVLLTTNPWTGTDSIILVGFFVLCVSQVVVLDCDVKALGGVYCYSFLTVMTIFALGNILLKIKRPSLPREVTTGWVQSIIGLIGVIIALLGNILGKPELLTYFFVYFILVGVLVLVMFQRVRIMRMLYKLLKPKERRRSKVREQKEEPNGELFPFVSPEAQFAMNALEVPYGEKDDVIPLSVRPSKEKVGCLKALSEAVQAVQDVPFVFFCKHDDLYMLNKAMLYIRQNEQTSKIIVVHCTGKQDDDEDSSRIRADTSNLTEHVKLMDLLYPRIKISLLIVKTDFSPVLVEWLSQAINVPINAMFISCPDENFAMAVSQLRGMRIIFSYD